jgi:hypothetical protein
MKTGGQTMRAILRKNFGAGHCDMLLFEETRPRDWSWIRSCYPRLKSISGHGMVTGITEFEKRFPSARYFTVLRHPVDRTISHYQFLLNGGHRVPEFSVWLAENANYMTRKLAGTMDADRAIETLETKIGFTGFVETYDESLVLWKRWVGQEDIDISYQAVNRAKSDTVRKEILTGETSREFIEEHHREDLKVWDYAFSTLRERQRLAYGENLASDVEALRQSCQKGAVNENRRSRFARWKRNLIYRPGVRKADDNPYK